MSLVAIMARKRPKIGTIELTASIRESHDLSAEVTDSPVERGADISDHRRIRPDALTMEAIISDAATKSDAEVDEEGNVTREPAPSADGTTSVEAYQKLRELFEGAAVFDVLTSLRFYQRMHFTRFSVTRDRHTDAVIAFSAEMRQLTFVDSQVVQVSAPDAPKAFSKVDKGKQQTQTAKNGPSRTVLDDLAHKASGGKDPGQTLRDAINSGLR